MASSAASAAHHVDAGPAMLRPVSISHYLGLMRARGWSDAALCAGTRIDVAALADPEYLISQQDHLTLIGNMIRLSGDQGLALDLAGASEMPHFSVLAYAGQSCRTIREGLQEVWSRYGRVFGVFADVRVHDLDADLAVIDLLVPRHAEALYRFGVEEAVTVLLKLGRALSPDAESYVALELAYPRPGYADRYAQVFACTCVFDAPHTRLIVRRRWLDRPFQTNDAELHRACRTYLDRLLKQTSESSPLRQRLRRHLLERISQLPSLEEAAHAFHMSPRTLARQLGQQGCTYRELVDEIRLELAQQWLQHGAYSAKEISYRLGFSDVATFRRAFKGWTGQTVSQYGGAASPPHGQDR